MKEVLRQRARELGFDDCRFTTAAAPEFADRFKQWLSDGYQGEMAWMERTGQKRADPQQVLPGAKAILTLAASYHVANGESGPIARYARFTDYHDVLGERLKQLVDFVNELGGEGARTFCCVDAGPLLERDLAQRAGLGFIGKHTNLISRHLGNWLFLAEIITTLELPPDAPERNHCGSCTRCISACPTGAITAPFRLDSRRCISYLTIEFRGSIPLELRPAMGARIFGCDDCLAVCPWNRFAREGRHMQAHTRPDLAAPDLLKLLTLDEAGFKRQFAGTPLLRAKRRGLLRNVCVALGNTGDDRALPALHKAAQDAEPLVAEHARWAINRLGGAE
jgi:epoxyqueuosine reductase